MGEKKGLSTTLLLISIIVIIGLICYIYNLKTKCNTEILSLQENNKKMQAVQKENEKMQNTINELQEKIDSIANITNSKETKKDNISFSDEDIKTALTNYLEIKGKASEVGILDYLAKNSGLNYDSSKTVYGDESKDATITTNVKYDDFKKAILNYISEDEFENNFIKSTSFKKDNKGNLIYFPGGGGNQYHSVKSVEKKSENEYTAKVTTKNEDGDKTNIEYTFKIKANNGKCVIDSIEEK